MRQRRENFTETEVTKMRELEAQGKTRKEIAFEMQCHQSAVTRRLGKKAIKEAANEEEPQAA